MEYQIFKQKQIKTVEGNKENKYIEQAETLENDASQLEDLADIWEKGCRND